MCSSVTVCSALLVWAKREAMFFLPPHFFLGFGVVLGPSAPLRAQQTKAHYNNNVVNIINNNKRD